MICQEIRAENGKISFSAMQFSRTIIMFDNLEIFKPFVTHVICGYIYKKKTRLLSRHQVICLPYCYSLV